VFNELLTMTDKPEPGVPQSQIDNLIPDIGLPYPLPVMVESLLFVASEPVPVTQIAEALEVKVAAVEQALAELNAEIVARGVRVQRKGDKVQLTTQPECAPYVEKFLGLDLTTRLSKPALETLAIIAYQQPVTRAQIEHVRGVNCDTVLATLLNRGLIEELGRLETAGRPIQYGTTFAFLQHFGLRSLEDMPSLQPEEAAALEALAEQGQAFAVDLALPTERVVDEAVPAAPDRPVPPVETQLSLLDNEAPSADRADAVTAEVDSTTTPEAMAAELPEASRANEETAVIEPAPDRPESAIGSQSAEKTSPDENAAT
jgi:segregation and condensation protein B